MKITASEALALYSDKRFIGSLKDAFLANKKARDKFTKHVARKLASTMEAPGGRTRIVQQLLAHDAILGGAKNMVGRRGRLEAENDATTAGRKGASDSSAPGAVSDTVGRRVKKTNKKTGGKKARAKKQTKKKRRRS